VAGERVLVVGGTGFLGQHIVAELLGRGHPVTVLTRSPGAAVAAGVAAVAGDAEALDEDGFARLLDGCHGVVFAAGRDAAAPPPAPAERWFREGNVAPVARLAAGARRAGCRSLVVCGSYLTALDRAHPRVGLVRRHPYIRSRAEQAAAARAGAGRGPAVAVLEIPFVLGATPGRSGALEPLVPWLRSRWPPGARRRSGSARCPGWRSPRRCAAWRHCSVSRAANPASTRGWPPRSSRRSSTWTRARAGRRSG